MTHAANSPNQDKIIFTRQNPSLWTKQYATYLNAYAFNRIGNHEEARDLVQDTFLAALENSSKFEWRSMEKTWLVAILRNKIIDRFRKKQSERAFLGQQACTLELFDDPTVSKDLMEEISDAMISLPILWQKVFWMKNLEDRPTPEICRELAISDTHVWVILHRSRGKLKKKLSRIRF